MRTAPFDAETYLKAKDTAVIYITNVFEGKIESDFSANLDGLRECQRNLVAAKGLTLAPAREETLEEIIGDLKMMSSVIETNFMRTAMDYINHTLYQDDATNTARSKVKRAHNAGDLIAQLQSSSLMQTAHQRWMDTLGLCIEKLQWAINQLMLKTAARKEDNKA